MDVKKELNEIFFDEAMGVAAYVAGNVAGGVVGGVVGAKLGTAIRIRRCAKKYKKGTPEYKKCAAFRTGTPAGRLYDKGSKAVKKGIDKLRGKKSVKEELNDIFQEDLGKYLDLCKRKYHKLPEQYQKCRAAVTKRYGNG